jgi:osmoprotectant transport system ATP-binding protein
MFPIRFEHLTHRFGTREVLHDVTAEIPANAITALIGRSGSGKSTLLQTVNGMIVPSEGRVLLFDAPIDYAHIHEVRRPIGYAVQGTGLFPHLTIRDNIAILGRVTNMPAPDIDRRIDHLLQLVGLNTTFLHAYPHELSGGEQQRVGLCRAMLLNPPIFLLDEPFGALDPATRSDIHREVLALQRAEPRTILFVTHDMQEATTLADWIMVMDNGEVQRFDAATRASVA